ncbi:MAG: hypothetical protein ACP5F6_03075 [Microbacter sp.]
MKIKNRWKPQWMPFGFIFIFFILAQPAIAAPHFHHQHLKTHSKMFVQSYHKHCIKMATPAVPAKKKNNNNRKITSFTSPSFHLFGYYAEETSPTILNHVVEVTTLYSFSPFYQGINSLDTLRAPPFSTFC